MMRILLLGKNGQLGWELQRTLATLGQVVSLDYPDVDFTKARDLRERVLQVRPDVIVNAAAYTAVDRAESETESCSLINGVAPGVLAEAAAELKAVLLHYSTDYVFDGAKSRPYVEDDQPNPISFYGESKLQGEQAIQAQGCRYLIFRTSWMYSWRRENYMKKVLEWARTYPILRVVTDQLGSPTSARMLAEITSQTLALGSQDLFEWISQHEGIYHLAGDGTASRFEWTQEIVRFDPQPEKQVLRELQPATLSDFPSPAPRPVNSALNCDRFYRTFGLRLPPWQEALMLMMKTA